MAQARVEIQVFLDNLINTKLVGTSIIDSGGSTNTSSASLRTQGYVGPYMDVASNNRYSIADNQLTSPLDTLQTLDSSGLTPFAAQRVSWGTTRYYYLQARESYMLDLYQDTQIPITYQVTDLTDISSINSSYTKTIVIPETNNNMTAFKWISDLASDSSFNPNKRARSYVLVDSVIVLEGYIQLVRITKNKNTGVNNLECVIYADNDNLWKSMGERMLEDLNFRELDHPRNVTSVTQSWTKTVDQIGYYYPLIDYGSSGDLTYQGSPLTSLAPAYGDWTLFDIGGTTPVITGGGIGGYGGGGGTASKQFLTPGNFYPAVYVKTIIDKIFQQAGYEYKSNFFNSTYFKNLMIPFSRTMLRRSPSFEYDKVFRVGMGYIPMSPTQSVQYGTHSMVMGRNKFYAGNYFRPDGQAHFLGRTPGIGNLYWNGTSYNDVDFNYEGVRLRLTDDGTNFGGGYTWPWNVDDADPGNNWDHRKFTFNNATSATSSGGWQPRVKQRFGVYYKINIVDIDRTDNSAVLGTYPYMSNHMVNGSYGAFLTVRRSRNIVGATYSWITNNILNGAPGAVYTGAISAYGTASTGLLYNKEGVVPVNGQQSVASGGGTDVAPIRLNIYDYTYDPSKYVTFSFTPSGSSTPIVCRKYTFEGQFYTDWLNSDDLGTTNYWYPPFKGEQFFLDFNHNLAYEVAGLTAAEICPETYIWNEIYPDVDPVTGSPIGVTGEEPVDMSQVLPINIKQRDFLMSIIKMFNLIVEPAKNEFYPNLLTIEPRDTYYDSGVVKDWTSKVDMNQDVEIQILGETQNKTNLFKFKDDTDFYNTAYKNKWTDTYGTYRFTMDNDFIEGEKKMEVIFAATPLVSVINSRGFIIPKIHKLNNNQFVRGESAIRIVRKTDSGLLQNPYGEYWSFGASGSHTIPGAIYKTFSTYPYVGHFDNPYTPTDDLNFGQTQELFYDATSTVTNQNLFTKYWYRQMNEYADKNSRIITANMYLLPQDIYDFRFSDKIFIDGQYYKVLKIDGYDAANPYSTCKVQMIKTLNYQIPKALPRRVNPGGTLGGIGVGMSLTSLGSAANRIMSSNAGAVGRGNIIADASPGAFVAGQGNVLSGFNSGVIVSGNNNQLNSGAISSNVFGDSNIVQQLTTATIFGSSNSIATQSNATLFGQNNAIETNVLAHVTGNNNYLYATMTASATDMISIVGHNNIVSTASQVAHIVGSNNNITGTNVHVIADNLTSGSNNAFLVNKNNALIAASQSTISGGQFAVSSLSQFSGRATFSSNVAMTAPVLMTNTVTMNGSSVYIANLTQTTNINNYFA